ncbi:AP1G1 [Lepeophtheirus salmonis]|uniref:AP1G1 n=1 Tax=Lepeophtheirus salmonis TaxID=72036 RepID=A0A7R8CQY3_LEPSM|nr:AP1G1 [Lepeophtheirus salmonis]CAF2900179.1 AP1G1 [Lepeophtheirus salmonis]
MELCFALINGSTYKSMMKELLSFLHTAEPEFKTKCSSSIFISAERYSPNKRNHIDTLIEVLKAAGNYVRDDVVFSSIQLVSGNPNHQAYAVKEIWKALKETEVLSEKQPLVQVSCWCIGEYGGSLCNEGEESRVREEDILDVYHKILWSFNNSLTTKQYALMSIAKLSTRLPKSITPKIQEIVDTFGCHMEVDLQQRGVEFSRLFREHNNLRPAILESMPPLERDSSMYAVDMSEPSNSASTNGLTETTAANNNNNNINNSNESGSLLVDLIDGNQPSSLGGESTLLDLIGATNVNNSAPPPLSTGGQDSLLDLLGDIDFKGHSNIPAPMPNSVQPISNGTSSGLDDLLGDLTSISVTETSNTTISSKVNNIPSITVYEKADLKVVFNFEKLSSTHTRMTATATNSSSSPISDYVFF